MDQEEDLIRKMHQISTEKKLVVFLGHVGLDRRSNINCLEILEAANTMPESFHAVGIDLETWNSPPDLPITHLTSQWSEGISFLPPGVKAFYSFMGLGYYGFPVDGSCGINGIGEYSTIVMQAIDDKLHPEGHIILVGHDFENNRLAEIADKTGFKFKLDQLKECPCSYWSRQYFKGKDPLTALKIARTLPALNAAEFIYC